MGNTNLNVFISWSGTPSREIAHFTKTLLEKVFALNSKDIKFFLSSSEDGGIDKGERFQNKLDQGLFSSNFGILILTKNNIERPWIMFEAGSLAKNASVAKVSPVLFDIEEYGIDKNSPLHPFQHTKFTEGDFNLLFQSILKSYNGVSELKDNEKEVLSTSLKNKWEEFEKDVKKLLDDADYRAGKLSERLQNNEPSSGKLLYLKREQHLGELINDIERYSGNRLIIFGGIPTIIRDATKELAKWIIGDEHSQLFICYENDDLINDRKEDLKNNELLNEKKTKLEKFKNELLDLLGEGPKARIHFIELSERLSVYITLNGIDMFFTPLLNKRSSLTFTYKLEKEQILDGVDYITSKSTHALLKQELERLKSELQIGN